MIIEGNSSEMIPYDQSEGKNENYHENLDEAEKLTYKSYEIRNANVETINTAKAILSSEVEEEEDENLEEIKEDEENRVVYSNTTDLISKDSKF